MPETISYFMFWNYLTIRQGESLVKPSPWQSNYKIKIAGCKIACLFQSWVLQWGERFGLLRFASSVRELYKTYKNGVTFDFFFGTKMARVEQRE